MKLLTRAFVLVALSSNIAIAQSKPEPSVVPASGPVSVGAPSPNASPALVGPGPQFLSKPVVKKEEKAAKPNKEKSDQPRIRRVSKSENPVVIFRGAQSAKKKDAVYQGVDLSNPKKTDSTKEVAWLGFKPTDGNGRIFVQTTAQDIDVQTDGRSVVVRLKDASASTNDLRPFDTSAFRTPVSNFVAINDKNDLLIKVDLIRETKPRVSRDGQFIVIDFKGE